MSKPKTIRVKSVAQRVQFALYLDGSATPVRATVTRTNGQPYHLRYRTADGDVSRELRADDTLALSYDVDGLDGVQRCSKHGVKIQRPAGQFDCETCFREYGVRARAAAKARKDAAARGEVVTIETPKARAIRLRKEAADARVTALMARLAGGGLSLATDYADTVRAAQQAEAEAV